MSRRGTWIAIIVSIFVFILLVMLALDARSQEAAAVVGPFRTFHGLSQRVDALENRVAALEADNTYLREQATKLIPYMSVLANATHFNSEDVMFKHQDMVAHAFVIGRRYRRGDGVMVMWTSELQADLLDATAQAVEFYNAVGNPPDLQLPPE